MLTFSKGIHTANDKAVVPWRHIAKAVSMWIDGWNDAIILKEPTDMSASELKALYMYLLGKGLNREGKLNWTTSEFRNGEQIANSTNMEFKDIVDQNDDQVINVEG